MHPAPFVHGKAISPPGGHLWCRGLAEILSPAVSVPSSSRSSTVDAETGLGIRASVYWYVRRVHHAYRDVIVLHSLRRDALRDADRGLCPFDTGALWSGKTIRSSLSGDEKRAYFVEHDYTITTGLDAFPAYVARNHGTLESYDRGTRPAADLPEFRAWVGADCPWFPWTWELRVEKPRVHALMVLETIFWAREQEEEFGDWLMTSSGLPTRAKEELFERIRAATPTYRDGEGPYDCARRIVEAWS